MKALFFIAKQNLKKKKGDVLVLGFLIMLAALLFYTSMSVFLGTDKIIEDAYKNGHTPDLMYISNVAEEKIKNVYLSREEVEEYEASRCLWKEGEYRKEGEKESKQTQFIFGSIEEERKMGDYLPDRNDKPAYDAIYLPYYMKETEGYEEGDTFYYTVGKTEYAFQVKGFVEDPLFATPLNITMFTAYITNDCMTDMVAENESMKNAQYTQHKVRLKAGEDSFLFDNEISPVLTQEIPELSETTSLGVNWESMKGGVAMMSDISMGIVLVFSVLLLCVVLIVMRFSIRNYIEMNLKNIGILQAAGYTPKQLNIATMLEMGFIAVISALLGVILGICGNSLIGNFEGIMLGLRWKQKFHVGAASTTMIGIAGLVFLVAFLCGRIYKKISVLESLRGGIHTHNFKKNYFGLHKGKLPIAFCLAGKNVMFEKAKNISIFIIVTILAFSANVGFGLYENFALRNDNMMKMVGAETGDVVLAGTDMETVSEELETWKEVKKVADYSAIIIEVESKEEKTTVTCDVWEEPTLLENEMIIEGRLPKYEDEIVLTTNIAKLLNVSVGDKVNVTGQGEDIAYIVSGIDQKMNNMGLKAMMAKDGAVRLNGDCLSMYLYVYTKGDISFDEISKKVKDSFSNISIMDGNKVAEGAMETVNMAMAAICAIFVGITVFVVVMVETLLVKSKIIRERKNLGLNKAFGFTTKQLISQTMMMNLPVITLGAVIGSVLSIFLMEPMVLLCLNFCGLKKLELVSNPLWIGITIVGILLIATLSAFLSSVKIRKIAPVQMLTDE